MEPETKELYPLKKYVVFAINQYYPSGGLDDIIGSVDTLEEVKALKSEHSGYDYYEVVDRDTWEVLDV